MPRHIGDRVFGNHGAPAHMAEQRQRVGAGAAIEQDGIAAPLVDPRCDDERDTGNCSAAS